MLTYTYARTHTHAPPPPTHVLHVLPDKPATEFIYVWQHMHSRQACRQTCDKLCTADKHAPVSLHSRQARTCVMTRASTERAKADMYCSNTASGTTRAISLCAYGSWSCVCVCVCVCVCACVWPRAYVTTLCWTRASHHNIISS